MKALAIVAVCACGRVDFATIATATDATAAIDSLDAPPPRIFAFIQMAGASSPTAGTAASAMFAQPVTAGDVIIAAFDVEYIPASSIGVDMSDTLGDTYIQAVSPTVESGYRQILAYAYAKTTGVASMTVTVTGDPTYTVELRLVEYAGIAAANPIDVTSANRGTAGVDRAITGLPLVTTGPDELIVGFAVGHPSDTLSAGAGFAPRNTFDGDMVEDEPAAMAGTYTPMALVDQGGTWTMYGVAFR